MSIDFKPRPEQEAMLAHLGRMPRKALHAGCGVGKTVVDATHIAQSLDRFDTTRWLVVAPKTVAEDTWQREFAKWRHLEHIKPRLLSFDDLDLQRGMEDGRAAGLEFGEGVKRVVKRRLHDYTEPVQVCSYQTMVWIARACGRNFPFDGVVFDESTFLKAMDSERWRMAKRSVVTLPNVRDVIENTGTPIPKGYEDLVAQFYLLDEGVRLGRTYTDFRSRWCEPGKRGAGGTIYSWDVKREMVEPIQKAIKELAVSVDHDTGVKLVESAHIVRLPAKARALYDEMKAKLLIEMAGKTIISANAAVLVGKLMQIANGYIYDQERGVHGLHTAKLDAVAEAVEANPTPVLLAWAHQPAEAALRKRLGAKMRLARDKGSIEAFRRGEVHVLGFHPETMSFGVDGLQGAGNTVFWYGPTHRWDWYHQVYKRLQREGQKADSVFVRTFVAENTLDQGIIDNVLVPRGERNDGLLAAIRAT